MKGKDPYVGMIGLLQYGPKKPLPKKVGQAPRGRCDPDDRVVGMTASWSD
jgi:hypothetical protein